MRAHARRAGVPEQRAQHQRHEDRVVELSDHRDEVGNQIERHRQVSDEGEEKELSRS